MEETTLWIMGLGPVIVHKQFVRDIGRRKRDWFLNGKPLPRDPRDALEQIYHFYGNKYYIITKYTNQTLGNMMYWHVKRMHWRGTLKVVNNSYVFHLHVNGILCELLLCGLDVCGRVCVRFLCACVYDMLCGACTIRVREVC